MKKINRKGFTLVELLAVIVILAVLALIAMPNVVEMMNNARRSSFVTEAENFAGYLKTAYMSDQVTGGASTASEAKSTFKDVTVSGKTYDYYCMTYTQMKKENYVTKSADSDYAGILELYILQSNTEQKEITIISLTNGDYTINGISLDKLATGYSQAAGRGNVNTGDTLDANTQKKCATSKNVAASHGTSNVAQFS